MPGLRKFLRETAYTVLATLAVAALLMMGFGFDGTWVVVVSVMAGVLLGRAVDGAVVLIRTDRARRTEPPAGPGTASPDS